MLIMSKEAKKVFAKYNYFSLLKEDVFIANNESTKKNEPDINMRILSFTQKEKKILHPKDIEFFLKEILMQKKTILSNRLKIVKVIFYVWVDELADQIRWSFISYDSPEISLPFGCNLIYSSSMLAIIQNYLKSENLELCLTESEDFQEAEDVVDEYLLTVYKEDL